MFNVYIRDNETGDVQLYVDHYNIDGGFNHYIWEEGNYSCDCNRRIFYFRAQGVEIENHECSDGRFSIQVEDVDTKQILYTEW